MPEHAPSSAPPHGVRLFVLGARPRTLPAAVVPVLVGVAASAPFDQHHGFTAPTWGKAAAALVVALALQVGVNYANDYSDGVRGTDRDRVGPLRLVGSGLATPRSVKLAALSAFGVAGLAGLVLAATVNWWILAVGVACLLAGWGYTGGPKPYGYLGFGELFVFVFFGLVATVGTGYVVGAGLGSSTVWVSAIVVGQLAVALLMANNVRDIDGDRESGKRTLAVRLGRARAGRAFTVVLLEPFAIVVGWVVLRLALDAHRDWRVLALLLPLAALPLTVRSIRLLRSGAVGRALLPTLAWSARTQMVAGAALAIGLLVVRP